jgi:peptidoglycan/LPS O-acetylase OafA/YrhL
MKYVRQLDGIRGIAVILVMLFHFGYFAPGWSGVQLFFVLSGFLITAILLDGRGAPTGRSLGRFYWRRSLRILPVFVALLLVLGLLAWLTGEPRDFGSDWPWLAGFLANFARLRETDLSPFYVHLWSLAVEEQFYLLWPFAILLLPMAGVRRLIIGMLLAGPVLRLLVFQHFVGEGAGPMLAGKAVYVLPFTQFDAFAAGAALAVWPQICAGPVAARFVACAGLTAMAGFAVTAWAHLYGSGAQLSALGFPMYLVPANGYIWGYSLLNLLFVALLALGIREHRWTSPLGHPALVHVGRTSYGLYVYHLPLLAAADLWFASDLHTLDGLSRFGFFIAWIAVVVLVAEISHRYLEKPFLRLKDRFSEKAPGMATTADR